MSVELQTSQLRIGEWLVEPALDQISRAREIIKLEPRTMRLLMRLAQTPGQVVSSQQLLDEVWFGVVVGPASLYQAISQLRKLLGDLDATPTYIATVPRKGYRLIAPVRAVDSVPTDIAPSDIADDRKPVVPVVAPAISFDGTQRRRRLAPRMLWALAIVSIAIIGAAAALYLNSDRIDSRVASIVVLPFVDMSGGQRDAAFCDGLTEELSTTLSYLPALRVVARTSAYAFRNQAIDVREIGRRLSATHVLEGSVQRSGDAVRVTARLVDTRRGYRRWSESFDLPAKDVLSLQSDIARSVASALEIGFSPEASTRIGARGSGNAEAYELYLLGRHYYRQRTPEDNARAIELNSRAVALDRDFALAYVGLAQARLAEYALAQRPIHELSSEVEHLVETAMRLDPDLSDAYATRGALRREQNRLEDAEKDLHRAIALNPSDVTAAVNLGRVFEHKGLPRQALYQLTQALLIDPLDFMRHVERCITLQDLGEYAEASGDCEEGRRLQPESEWGFMATSWLAMAQGRLADALRWNDQALRVAPRNLDLYMQRADLLRDLHSFDEAQSALDRALAVAGDDPRLRYRYADLLLIRQGPAAVREFVAQLPLTDSVSAADLVIAAQISLTVGDEEHAKVLAARAVAAPDFDSLRLGQYSAAAWGFSYQLLLAAVELRSGDAAASAKRTSELLQLLDEMERNGYSGWGVHALRADAYGLRGDADKAMESLRRAVREGWRGSWAAQRHPYLAPLFEREDFQALMRGIDELNAAEHARYAAISAEHAVG